MPKIVFLPLDERPCNVRYPESMFHHDDINLVLPKTHQFGQKKIPATYSVIRDFLLTETKDADGLVISMDMLLYGGIVPSRLHDLSEETLASRYDLLDEIKAQNPKLEIYAFDLVMRCPQYSSNDEEPDYYQHCGLEIFLSGFLGHKQELGIITEPEKQRLEGLKLPKEHLEDYLSRRALNLKMNQKTIDYVKRGIIQFLVIPQDDAAEYGYTAKDQKVLKKVIDQACVESKVYIYPGADEVANTLVSRMITHFKQVTPKFYLHYTAVTSPQTIPLLEDRTLDVTLKYQVRAAGGVIVSTYEEADIVLFLNAPAERMLNNATLGIERSDAEQRKRNLVDFALSIQEAIVKKDKVVALADVFTLNGSDYELMKLLDQLKLLNKLDAYAGWNTSSNTLGTTIPYAIQVHLYGMTKPFKDFLMSRYVEDYGYMGSVRSTVNAKLKTLGMNYFDVASNLEKVEEMVNLELHQFVKTYLPSIASHIQIHRVWMPWKRMFEVGVDVSYIE